MLIDALNLARKDLEEQYHGSPPYELAELPVDGRILQPLIGRQRVVDEGEDGKPNPKVCRSSPSDIYEVFPEREPTKSMTMKILAEEGVTIPVRLREDFTPKVAKALRDGYEVEWGFQRVDPWRKIGLARWHETFRPGEVKHLTMEAAVGLLIHTTHGRFVEEAPQENL